MNMRNLLQDNVSTITAEEIVVDAARVMRSHHVGSLVVIEERDGIGRVPVGVLTDRDVTVSVVAQTPSLTEKVLVGEVMSAPPLTVRIDDDVNLAAQKMRGHGVRRAPVIDEEGALVGILALDDILVAASDQLSMLADLMRRERRREATWRT